MTRDEKTSATDAPGILRTPGLNEILPRHDLDLFTSSRLFPEGDWILSELGRCHQFQAVYCIPNQQGQLIPAPMPPANISAVTNEEEIYQHCTVYQFTPSYQSRRETEHLSLSAISSDGQQQRQHHGRGQPACASSFQQVSLPSQISERNCQNSNRKHHLVSQNESSFLVSPPSYTPVAVAHAFALPLEKETAFSTTPIQNQNFVNFTGEYHISDHSCHKESSVSSGSYSSISHHDIFPHHPESEEIHGLESFTSQDFHSGVHDTTVGLDESFNVEFSPAMMTLLEGQTLDEILGQGNDIGRVTLERAQVKSEERDRHDDTTLSGVQS
ncbi:uncharacterized protein CTRU02_207657 [Colletotrichum truncatum]|uniref:Uncharacterized protein n=1 Tax=Colletotrichum truncatum TaxID=5467 RepID=A0ACC3Z1F2_COLTU|nr:uncharacterized protein CTRU02_09244 [Colletotrichum truncatum]KAF6788923.1 hypothetical protein CTRU02_09244 [Colletotrichum truncatum]